MTDKELASLSRTFFTNLVLFFGQITASLSLPVVTTQCLKKCVKTLIFTGNEINEDILQIFLVMLTNIV